MSDKMRWRYGDTNPVVAAVDSATIIEIGDLLWQDSDDAKPASVLPSPPRDTDEPSCPARQRLFAERFLGVAMQRSHNVDMAPIRVATTGVFEMDCPSSTFELGDLVGANENAGGDGLLDQQVAMVTLSKYAIGRVAKREVGAATGVLVDIRSTVMTGGVVSNNP